MTKFRRSVHAVPIYDKLCVEGLKEEKDYKVESHSFIHALKRFGNLINFVTPVKVNADGKLVELISKYRGLEANVQKYEASGAALEDGIILDPLFLGTGYNESIRIPLDYGSDMYLIKEKKNVSGKEK